MTTLRTLVAGAGLLLAGLLAACTQLARPETEAAPGLASYFPAPDTMQRQTGGVQIVPISTPKGKFNVWTKRIGHNPRLKLLLLNGGPGATHEYFECMESFLPREGVEIIYYDQLGCGNSDNPGTPACGACRATWRKWSRCAKLCTSTAATSCCWATAGAGFWPPSTPSSISST